MGSDGDSIIESYSRRAGEYAGEGNFASCWGSLSESLWAELDVRPSHRLVADVGCGPGTTLEYLAKRYPPATRLVGVEPAESMRVLGSRLTELHPNVEFLDGRFESLPFESESVDYLYSIMAFHWVTDAEAGAREIGRVLRREASADIFFVGRWNGREFINITTPIFLKYMGASNLFASARLRKQLTAEEATDLFSQALPDRPVWVRELYKTYHDTLEGHWRWWVRIGGQLDYIPQSERARCEGEVRLALRQLEGPEGIPYTVHVLHAKVGRGRETEETREAR
ncbi:MAG TPA: class I SAM-dependent methyltransferase [Pyrinomonadaceae bacterium]|nr:class I SAM-dependent methyltransferase [Pyrinomonadaceae bacterium]